MNYPLHHVSLLTGDAAATVTFYTQQLGLRLVKQTVNQENWRMPHLFFGDALGTPGSVVTFFVIDHLGPRYDGTSFMDTLALAIPTGSAAFWQQRLGGLMVRDPNGVTVTLVETPAHTQAPVENEIPAANQISGLAGSALRVPDPKATRQFFAQLLALPAFGGDLQLGPDTIAITASQVQTKHRDGRGSIDHIALAVTDADQLTVLANRTEAAGGQIEKRADRGWFESLYVKEPGGNRIEFATTVPGFTLDEPAATLGTTLGLPPFLEPHRADIADGVPQLPLLPVHA